MENFWFNKRVFITGATGLLGSWLTKRLIKEKAQVFALIRDFDPQSELIRSGDYKNISLINGQLQDFSALERAINSNEIEYVFHLAAQAIVGTAYKSPLETFESNIRGTYNLLEACRRFPELVKAIVVASSDKAYGSSSELPYKEFMPLKGIYPYEVSKSCTDLIADSYAKTYNLPIAISRCGNIYGGADFNWSRIIPGTIQSLINNSSPIIRSNGQFLRDYLYVEDVVSAYLLLAENLQKKEIQGQAFNFSPSKPYSVLEIVSLLQKIMNKKNLQPIILNNCKGEIKDQYLESSKAYNLLKWTPLFSLEAGLKETVKWYERYFEKM
jgi:CDP-glucose 4,6-dehydratase